MIGQKIILTILLSSMSPWEWKWCINMAIFLLISTLAIIENLDKPLEMPILNQTARYLVLDVLLSFGAWWLLRGLSQFWNTTTFKSVYLHCCICVSLSFSLSCYISKWDCPLPSAVGGYKAVRVCKSVFFFYQELWYGEHLSARMYTSQSLYHCSSSIRSIHQPECVVAIYVDIWTCY